MFDDFKKTPPISSINKLGRKEVIKDHDKKKISSENLNLDQVNQKRNQFSLSSIRDMSEAEDILIK